MGKATKKLKKPVSKRFIDAIEDFMIKHRHEIAKYLKVENKKQPPNLNGKEGL